MEDDENYFLEEQATKFRKVASSRLVYYSIFDHSWGATNQDMLLSEMCYYCHVQELIN